MHQQQQTLPEKMMKQGYLTDAMYGRMNKNFQVYGDFMAMFNKTFGDFSINAALGTSINVSKANSLMIDSKQHLYIVLMYLPFPISYSLQRDISTKQLMRNVLYNLLFGTAQVGWKDAILFRYYSA